MTNVTAVLAHPDDELMCAGTLARFVREGNDVTVVTMFMDERLDEWRECTAIIGCNALSMWWENEDDFIWSRRTVRKLEKQLELHNHVPTDLWITHRANDANTSHGHIARIVQTLARKNKSSVWEIDQVIPGGIVDSAPNHYVNTSSHLVSKARAVEAYKSQLLRYPGLETAIANRDALYGWQIGSKAAEGFNIHKSVLL